MIKQSTMLIEAAKADGEFERGRAIAKQMDEHLRALLKLRWMYSEWYLTHLWLQDRGIPYTMKIDDDGRIAYGFPTEEWADQFTSYRDSLIILP